MAQRWRAGHRDVEDLNDSARSMAFDPGLAQRIRDIVQHRPDVAEKRMFGGLAFMRRGHMFVGVVGDTLMARVGPAAYAGTLEREHVREMDFTGRPMKGYVYVEPAGTATDAELASWVDRCAAFVATLPPKVAA